MTDEWTEAQALAATVRLGRQAAEHGALPQILVAKKPDSADALPGLVEYVLVSSQPDEVVLAILTSLLGLLDGSAGENN